MTSCPRLKKTTPSAPHISAASYRLSETVTGKRLASNAIPRVVLPNGRSLTQNPSLPRIPGQSGLHADRPVDLDVISAGNTPQDMPSGPPAEGYFNAPDIPSPSKHRSKHLKQWQTRTEIVLPQLLQPYLEFQCKLRSLRDAILPYVETEGCRCCQHPRKLTIVVIRFSSTFSSLI